MYTSKKPSSLWIWWRRYAYNLRRFRFKSCICITLGLLFFLSLPNPFSSKYKQIPIKQNVKWDSVSDLIQTKESILANDELLTHVKVIHHGKEKKLSSQPILILLYTTIFLNKKYCQFTIERTFGVSCPSKNRCKWTCNRQHLHQADAIIFHAYDVQYYQADIPDRSKTKSNSIWILWSDEPPTMVDFGIFKSYQFNWTLSYKLNSEVSIGSYGLITKRAVPWSNTRYNQWIEEQFSKRLNGTLWFVSNCKPKQRLQYYYDLRKEPNLLVEGYGRCVDYYLEHFCQAGSQCEYDYMSTYKYYLSFESTTCRDYITEKFYKALYRGLIPVVYGPDINDYNNIAPLQSFIHIKEFNHDMTQLAKHLEKVYSNIDLYSKYHQWRKTYEVTIDGKALERIRMCELCERLNKLHEDDVTYYTDIEAFFNERCS